MTDSPASASVAFPCAVVVVHSGDTESLGACLRSIGAQARPPRRVVVATDGPAPRGLIDAVRAFPSSELAAGRPGRGVAAALNAAVAACDDELVAIVDGATRPRADWLATLLARAETHPGESAWASVLLAEGTLGRVEAAGLTLDRRGEPLLLWRGRSAWLLPGEPTEVFGAPLDAALFRRALLRDTGAFDERLARPAADADFALRARLAGHACVLVPAARAEVRVAPDDVAGRAFPAGSALYLLKSMPAWWLACHLPRLAFWGAWRALAMPARTGALAALAAHLRVALRAPAVALERSRVRATRRVPDADLRRLFADAPVTRVGRQGAPGPLGVRPVEPSTSQSEDYELANALRRAEGRATLAPLGCGIDFLGTLPTRRENEGWEALLRERFALASVSIEAAPIASGEPDRLARAADWCQSAGVELHVRLVARGAGALSASAARLADAAGGRVHLWHVECAPGRVAKAAAAARALAPGGVAVVVRGAFGFFDACDRALEELERHHDRTAPLAAVSLSAAEPAQNRFPLDHVRWAIDRFASLGVPVHVVDVMPPADGRPIRGSHVRGTWDEAAQAQYAGRLLRVCRSHPAVAAVWWRELAPWTEPGGGLYRADGTERPAADAVRDRR